MRSISRFIVVAFATTALLAASAMPAFAKQDGTKSPKREATQPTGGEDNNVRAGGGGSDKPADTTLNDHPSGNDRNEEKGGPGNQGNSGSDPDDMGNGGEDKPGGAGGFDEDKDGNNGCGNDDDFEDDNNGWCGKPPLSDDGGNPPDDDGDDDEQPPVVDDNDDGTQPGGDPDVIVEGTHQTNPNGSKGPAADDLAKVGGRSVLPFTGSEAIPLVIAVLVLAALGGAFLYLGRRRSTGSVI